MVRTRLQKSTTDYFSKLPPEILLSIFAYFCPHCCNEYKCLLGNPPEPNRAEDTTTLYNLCLVSRYFQLFAQDTLYHSFNPCYTDTARLRNPWELRLEPFLQAIASRPDLARSVKTVFLRVRLIQSLDFEQSRKAFDACTRVFGYTALEVYEKSLITHSSAIRRSFLRGARPPKFMRPEDFIPIVACQLLSILVSILPNLCHLRIEKDCRWWFDVSPPTLKVLGVSSIPLKTLETDYALPLLLARTAELETLVTSASQNCPNMPYLRNLHIRSQNAVPIPSIEQLLSACTGTLSTFSYTTFDSDIVGVVNLLDKPRFNASIETLHLDMSWLDARAERKMPSLKQFTQFKRLFLHTYSLYGIRLCACCEGGCKPKSLIDILPPKITSLMLSEQAMMRPSSLMEDDLHILAKNVAVHFPQLKEIRSNVFQNPDKCHEALFNSVGVDLIHQALRMPLLADTLYMITEPAGYNFDGY